MKTRLIAFFVLLCLATAAFGADNPFMGKWKLNEAKSMIPAGGIKNSMVTYEAAGDQIKVTVEGTTGDGQSFTSVWTGKFDGKDYALSNDPLGDMRSYKQAGARTANIVTKKAGKVTSTTKVVVSPDGKTRTVNSTSTDAKGKKTSTTAVYDKM